MSNIIPLDAVKNNTYHRIASNKRLFRNKLCACAAETSQLQPMTLKEAVKKFVEYSLWIRELSAPQLKDVESADAYREKLIRSFMRIGDIAKLNEEAVSSCLMPVLESRRLLSEEEVDALLYLKEQLLDAYRMDNLDIPVLHLVTQRLYADAERKHDVSGMIRAMDDYVMACYALFTMTRRLLPFCTSADGSREEGIRAAERILEYLDPARFALLPENTDRETVLINSRYVMALHEEQLSPVDEKTRESYLAALERALALKDDPFYRKNAPDFDWTYHEFRTLHYLANLAGFYNASGYNAEQLSKINSYTKRLRSFWGAHKSRDDIPDAESTVQMHVLRNGCLAGEFPVSELRKELIGLARENFRENYDYEEMILTTSVPLEYIRTVDPRNLSKEQGDDITYFYRQIVRYVHNMNKNGHLTFLLSELSMILDNFIDVEDGIDFETMCLDLIAAVHPPTYVHSLSVADLTACLTKHLFRKHPEMFSGVRGYPDPEALEELAWHAAVCHDIGKLFIVETIITYGRDLYDREFDWIRTHPDLGASLLAKHEKTAPYVNVVRGHHRWYDGKGGYPESYHPEDAPDRVLVDLVACADCLDASTDSVGRSYKKGKTLDEFIEELHAGTGTQFAPFLTELFDDEAVYWDLEQVLNAGREEKYRKTYRILENVLK